MNINRDTCSVHAQEAGPLSRFETPRPWIEEDEVDDAICYIALFAQMTVSADYSVECVIHSILNDVSDHPWRTDYEQFI